MRSNLRWRSDVFEITCWNGDIVRIVFVIDAHDREVLAWHAAAGTGISGSMVRDLMLAAVYVDSIRAATSAPLSIIHAIVCHSASLSLDGWPVFPAPTSWLVTDEEI